MIGRGLKKQIDCGGSRGSGVGGTLQGENVERQGKQGGSTKKGEKARTQKAETEKEARS